MSPPLGCYSGLPLVYLQGGFSVVVDRAIMIIDKWLLVKVTSVIKLKPVSSASTGAIQCRCGAAGLHGDCKMLI